MKLKLVILYFVLFLGINSYAQIPKFAAEINFPITTGDNFFKEGYNGVVDLGFQYRFINARVVNIGLSINGGLYNADLDDIVPTTLEVNTYVIQPRVFAELNIEPLTKLHPSIGLGYTFMNFDVDTNTITASDFIETRSGFNLNLGLAYDIIAGLHVKIQYDYIALKSEDDVPDVSFNNTLGILKLGVGYRL